MSFGFSIGDFITVTQIAWNTYTALRDASEDFNGFASEVHSLYTALMCLRDEARSPSSILQYAAPQKLAGLKDVIENCENSLQGLQKRAKKVCFLQPKQKRQFWEEFKLAFKDRQGPRDRIAIHTASINMFLSSLTHNSLGRLELLLKSALQSPAGSFSVSSNIPRGLGKDGQNTWNEIGQDLLMEGIGEKHFRRFADEIKAYMRYLVQGGDHLSEMNFRLDRSGRDRRNQYQVHERIDAPARMSPESSLDTPANFYVREDDDDDQTVSAKISRERESVDIEDLVHSFDELFPINEQGLAAESNFVEPSFSRLEIPKSKYASSSTGRNSPSTPSGTDAFRELSPDPRPRIETDKRVKAVEAEKRAKATEEARAKLIKYEKKKEEAERAGNRAKAADIRDNVIPDLRQRLDDLSSSSRRTSCDFCLGPIVERYSHCHICQGGNYDLCKSCVESGTKCDGNHHLEKREWIR